MDFRKEAEAHGLQWHRAAALNTSPEGVRALAAAVRRHLLAQEAASPEYWLRCAACRTPQQCRRLLQPAHPPPPHAALLTPEHEHPRQ